MSTTRLVGVTLGVMLSAAAHAETFLVQGLFGVPSPGICAATAGRCISFVEAASVATRACTSGPRRKFYIAGHSFGASEGITMARILEGCGHTVAALVLLDSTAYPEGITAKPTLLCSIGYGGPCNGSNYSGGHIELAKDADVHALIRSKFGRGTK